MLKHFSKQLFIYNITIIFILVACRNKNNLTIAATSDNMENTLMKGHEYIFQKEKDYKVGDIVAIRNIDFIDKAEKTSIFRIIAKKGDIIQFKNGIPFVNNVQEILPKTSKRFYLIQSKDLLNIELTKHQVIYQTKDSIILNLSFDEKMKLEKTIMLKEYALDKVIENSYIKFKCCQNHDFFGPFHLPAKITISDSGIVMHKGKWTQDLEQEELFFVIGDNVQDAIDSRYIGLVPASYILGKLISKR